MEKAIEKADEIEEKIIRNPAYGKGYELDNIKNTKEKRKRINWEEKIKEEKEKARKRREQKKSSSTTTTTTTTTTTYNEPKEPTKFPGFPGAVDLDEPLPKEPTKFPGFPGAIDLDEPPLISSDEENDDTETEDDDNADTEPYGNFEGGNKLKF